MLNKILPILDVPHHTFVDVFGGAANVIMNMPPSNVEVYNDLNSDLVGFFRMLRDPEQFEEFHRLATLTPFSREEFYHCRDTWRESEGVERWYKYFVMCRMSFGGSQHSWGFSSTITRRGMASTCSKWLSMIDHLPAFVERLQRIQIEHYDWRKILEIYDRDETLFYMDPPYVHSTRSHGGYEHEMSDDDHRELVERVQSLKGMVALSGYENEIYNMDWKVYSWDSYARGAADTTRPKKRARPKRTEMVWTNEALEGKREGSLCLR